MRRDSRASWRETARVREVADLWLQWQQRRLFLWHLLLPRSSLAAGGCAADVARACVYAASSPPPLRGLLSTRQNLSRMRQLSNPREHHIYTRAAPFWSLICAFCLVCRDPATTHCAESAVVGWRATFSPPCLCLPPYIQEETNGKRSVSCLLILACCLPSHSTETRTALLWDTRALRKLRVPLRYTLLDVVKHVRCRRQKFSSQLC